jgi:hypothetical protein
MPAEMRKRFVKRDLNATDCGCMCPECVADDCANCSAENCNDPECACQQRSATPPAEVADAAKEADANRRLALRVAMNNF